ncbi:MAG: MerR family transcriptional regulator [Bacteroidetes bacterium]|nr:MerR family transcriptional regulator [Bacteroidota bacterium]
MVQVPEDEILFQKHYYSIGEVASMLNVNPSLLRYWETEFSIIKPRKNKKGDRFYRPEDVKTLQMIQFLLREKKFTLEGAKTFLKKGRQDAENAFALVQSLQQLKALLQSIRADL